MCCFQNTHVLITDVLKFLKFQILHMNFAYLCALLSDPEMDVIFDIVLPGSFVGLRRRREIAIAKNVQLRI